MQKQQKFAGHRPQPGFWLLLSMGVLFAAPAAAFQFDLGEVKGTLDSNVSAGVAMRMEDPEDDLIGIANGGSAFSTNGDDGNLAFKKGKLFSTPLKLTSDLTLTYAEFGAFLRGTFVYDHRLYKKDDFFDPEDFAGPPGRTQGPADFDRKTEDVRNLVGKDGDLLDAYVFGQLDIFGKPVSFRLGKQVVNWGESTFVFNGINSLVAANANRARGPGARLEEIFVPAEMLWVGFNVMENVDAEIFYQWKWRESVLDASGTFLSTNDFAGVGGERVETGLGRCPENSAPGTCGAAAGGSAAPRGPDNTPDDGGQYGLGITLNGLPGLENLVVGVFAMNYHSRLPLASGTAATTPGVPGTTTYIIEYPEDIRLYGLSFNTTLDRFGIALQGEYSLKQDQPLQIEDVELLISSLRVGLPNQIDALRGGPPGPGEYVRGYIRRDVSQIDLSATKIIGPISWLRSDQLVLLGEVGYSHVHSMPGENELRMEGPGTYTPGNPAVASNPALNPPGFTPLVTQTDGYADADSWGYRLLARLSYNNVLNRFNVNPRLFFAHDVSGTSPTPILNFVDGRRQVTLGADVDFLQVWEFDLGYTIFSGGGDFNLLQDRDFLSMSVKYSF
jgi:hypothetical protein